MVLVDQLLPRTTRLQKQITWTSGNLWFAYLLKSSFLNTSNGR